MVPVLLAGSACGVIILFIYLAVTSVKPRKSKAEKELQFDDEYRIEYGYDLGGHEEELQDEALKRSRKYQIATVSIYDRVIKGLFGHALELSERFTPRSYIEKTEQKMRYAGKRGPEELDHFLAIRVLTAGAGIALAIITVFVSRGAITLPNVPPKAIISLFGFLTLLAFAGPEAQLNREADARKTEIQLTLPDVLDLLTVSVEAGLGFEQAIQYVAEMMEGPLCDEFNRVNAEMRAGASRADALKNLEERVGVEDVGHFVLAILQADRFGVSISRILRSQADEMRQKRHARAQEQAQKAPVKMLIPMTIFIFPPLFIVVLGPALISIAANFKS